MIFLGGVVSEPLILVRLDSLPDCVIQAVESRILGGVVSKPRIFFNQRFGDRCTRDARCTCYTRCTKCRASPPGFSPNLLQPDYMYF
ncbi:MAG: hypothetical protein K0B11_02485 [Mariniphaga sp.]|nr:hypothetical protein [Mariniphaga sp.]